jgi:hypothetical protein
MKITDEMIEAGVLALKNFEQDDGFDRQGSHAAGKLVHYTWKLTDYIEDWRIESIVMTALEAALQTNEGR